MLRLGISQPSPKRGWSLGDGAGGWTHTVYTATPGIPGDSGSGFMDAGGHALGILSTVAIAPLARVASSLMGLAPGGVDMCTRRNSDSVSLDKRDPILTRMSGRTVCRWHQGRVAGKLKMELRLSALSKFGQGSRA